MATQKYTLNRRNLFIPLGLELYSVLIWQLERYRLPVLESDFYKILDENTS